MPTDVFNNPSNDYVYPSLSPCAGTGDDAYLEFTETGIGIISGSKILANINFSDLRIPVAAYSTETKILQEGEVIYITGLTKGLTIRQQVFTMPISPSLVTTNENLDPYFLNIDLSINYYKNFKYSYTNIDVSANYTESIAIEDALNIALGAAGINVTATYDPSNFSFSGSIEGYDYNISNVNLSIVNTSDNSSSPFAVGANDVSYNLAEDVSSRVSYAKYPNSAMQGIAMKSIYPGSTNQDPYDHWLYINHVSNNIILYENSDSVVGCTPSLEVGFDPATTLGVAEPDVSYYFFIDPSVAFGIFDISVGAISAGAPMYDGSTIDNTVIDDVSIFNCIITDSSITNSYIYDSSIMDSLLNNVSVAETHIIGCDVSLSILKGNTSLTYSLDASVSVWDCSIAYYIINGASINDSYIRDSSIIDLGVDSSNNIIDTSTLIGDVSLLFSDIRNCTLTKSRTYKSSIFKSSLTNVLVVESSINRSVLTDTSVGLNSSLFSYLYDVSVYNSVLRSAKLNNIIAYDSSVSLCDADNSEFLRSFISDSSLYGGTLVRNDSSITNSLLDNVWINAYRTLITASPSAGYSYTMDNAASGIDSSLNSVYIMSSTTWDSSFNNAEIYDSSIYRSNLQDTSIMEDVSITRCTLYNCPVDPSNYVSSLDSNRILLFDPSIQISTELDYDLSTYYTRISKELDVGMNGTSTVTTMSAGDYLNWVTVNGYWNKFGELYAWTSAADGTATENLTNLINGFYVYNPHTFNIKIEYILFV